MSAALGVIIGLVAGIVVGFALGRRLTRRAGRVAPPRPLPGEAPPAQVVPAEALRLILDRMTLAVVLLDVSSDVALANPAVRRMGIVRGGHLIVEELHRFARAARETGEPAEVAVDLPDSRLGQEPLAVHAYVVPLADSGYVALFLDDVTETRRLAAVRRDFVANISHELKTPVGALSLLGETIEEAADDPVAVRRFARRAQHEGERLGRLVQELIELSRLEGADPLPSTVSVVAVDDVIADALDQTRLAADAAGIRLVPGGESGLSVRGDATQLTTAITNLIGNAVAYSPARTRVAVGTKSRQVTGEEHRAHVGRYVEISVADQGIGIAEHDQERIFERFYRVDSARSRATGGTGLGLAIVKHIASNHGGTVQVWSSEGSGSTFTLRLPAAPSPARPGQPERATPAETPRSEPSPEDAAATWVAVDAKGAT